MIGKRRTSTPEPRPHFVVSVARDFSRFPGGRKKVHGRFSGEEFRERFSLPVLQQHRYVKFDLAGSAGYSSGFLDEAFGELGLFYPLDELRERVEIVAEDDPDAAEIAWRRIRDAASEKSSAKQSPSLRGVRAL